MVDVVKSLLSKCTVLEPARPPSEARKGARPTPTSPRAPHGTTPRSRPSPGSFAGAKCWRTARTGPSRRLLPLRRSTKSYVGRVLRLTLLEPDIIDAILGGRQPAEMTLAVLMRRFPVGWKEQRATFLN